MKLNTNRLYGYKIYNTREARYTNTYNLALYRKQQLEKQTNEKWRVVPTSKKNVKRCGKIAHLIIC